MTALPTGCPQRRTEHLAGVAAAQQVEERVDGVVEPVDDRLAELQAAVRDPGAGALVELARPGRRGR